MISQVIKIPPTLTNALTAPSKWCKWARTSLKLLCHFHPSIYPLFFHATSICSCPPFHLYILSPFIHSSPFHPFIGHSIHLSYPLRLLFTRPSLYPLIHPFILDFHLLCQPFIHPSTHPPIFSPTHSVTHLSILSPTYPSNHTFTHSSILSPSSILLSLF